MKTLFQLFLALFLCTTVAVSAAEQEVAQAKKISGVVTDEKGEPIIGANVSVKGTTVGSITDFDGNFSIEVPGSNAVLLVSYVGYNTQEIAVRNQTTLKIALKESTQDISEVVVVGYGTQKRRDVTGSVSSIDNSMITSQNTSNATQALRGQIAGLSIQQKSGKVGAESTVILRGQSAIGKTVQPLVIIDGMPSNFTTFNDMSPDDIERVDVLKDASSTAIYGSRASGGVIIVTTRAGREVKNQINYSGTVGISTMTRNPKMMNSQQYKKFYDDGVDFAGQPQDNQITGTDLENIERGVDTDWLGLVTQTGISTKHNVSLMGGSKNETHYMSLGYSKDEGVQKKDTYERYSLSARMSGRVHEKFNMGASLYGSYSTGTGVDGNTVDSAYRLRTFADPYDAEGKPVFQPFTNETAITNPLFELMNTYNETRRVFLRGSAFLEYKPNKDWTLKTNFMPSYNMIRDGKYTGDWTRANVGKPGTNTASNKNGWGISYLWENTIDFKKQLGKDHSLGVTGLFSMEAGRSENMYGLVQGLTYDNEFWYNMAASTSINSLTSSLSKSQMMSFMARVNYSFKDKYLLTVTGREDGSSKFSKGHKWGFFPSVALAWRASEEEFIKKWNVFSNLKVRLSYGVAGNNDVDPFSSFALLNTTIYAWDEIAAKGSAARMANMGLTWEKSKEWNLGFDFGFFDGRLNGMIDLYNKTTQDLILQRQIPSHQGVSKLPQNVGSVRNQGVELTLNSVNITNKDFTWTTNLNFAMNKNEIMELYGDKTDDVGNKWFIGQPVEVSYDYKAIGIWQLGEEALAAKYNAKPGYIKIYDHNGDSKISPAEDKLVLGNPFPSWTGGITNAFTYKNFDFSFFIYTRQGEFRKSEFHSAYANFAQRRYNVPVMDYWTPTNPSNLNPSPGSAETYVGNTTYKDCSFVRVGNITLGYDFTKLEGVKKAGFAKLRPYLQVNNPFTFTKYDGWDPEWGQARGSDVPFSTTTFMFGVAAAF